MMHRGRSGALNGALLGALALLASASWGQPPGSIPPIYAQRLQMPVRGDSFAQPSAVVADLHTGEIFVSDIQRNRVVIFDEKGRFRYQIPGGSAFVSPMDLAVDPEGYLFLLGQVSPDIALLDFDGQLIRRISLEGLPEDVRSPRFTSLALSTDGKTLFALDSENDRLWIADREGAVRHSIDMTIGRTQEEIDLLRYGHIDVYGDVLLVPIPTDGLVYLYDLDGNDRGSVGEMGSAECQTMFPAAAALDDAGRVIILDQQRALFMTWDLEQGVCLSEHYGFGNAPGAFYQPSDLALDAAGRLYVSQGFEGRIQVYEGAEPARTRRE
jgi:sugar lactone lactonase YvrE